MSDANSSLTIRVGTSGVPAALADLNSIGAALVGMGKSMLAEFAAPLAIGAIVSEIVHLTAAAINSAEAMGRLSQQTDFSVSTLEALRKQTALAGLDFSDLGASMGIFVVKMQEAREKGGAAMDVFRELGHDVAEAVMQGRPAEQVYGMIAQKFHEGAVAGREQAVAHELFGRAFKQWIPILNEGMDGLEKFRAMGGGITPEAIENATEFNRTMRELKEAGQDIFRTFAANILPTLREFATELKGDNEAAGVTVKIADVLSTVFKLLASDIAKCVLVSNVLGSEIGIAANVAWNNGVTAFEALKQILSDVVKMGRETITLFIDLASAVLHSQEAISNVMTGHFGTAREIIADDLATIKKDMLSLGSTAADVPKTVFGAWDKFLQNGLEGWSEWIKEIQYRWTNFSAAMTAQWGAAVPGARASTGGAGGVGGKQTPDKPDERTDTKVQVDELNAMREKVELQD